MKTLKTITLASMSLSALGIGGCDVFVGGHAHEDRVYAAQQPQYVQPQPVYVEQEPQYIIVQQAPPQVIVEHRPAPPSEGHVWVDGYWTWSNQRYSWEAGRYVVPPQADVVWVAPRYERTAQGYRYTAGRWKKNPGKDNNDGYGRGRVHGGN